MEEREEEEEEIKWNQNCAIYTETRSSYLRIWDESLEMKRKIKKFAFLVVVFKETGMER